MAASKGGLPRGAAQEAKKRRFWSHWRTRLTMPRRSCSTIGVLGDGLWDRFNGGVEGTRWYYGALVRCFAVGMPGRLLDRLSRAVEAFER
jgi:hypothetical protein